MKPGKKSRHFSYTAKMSRLCSYQTLEYEDGETGHI